MLWDIPAVPNFLAPRTVFPWTQAQVGGGGQEAELRGSLGLSHRQIGLGAGDPWDIQMKMGKPISLKWDISRTLGKENM